LRASHILPAFLFRWLRETGGTPHIRHSTNPNVRVQDGLKVPMLCDECEKHFNRYETDFSKRLFYPVSEDSALVVPYGEWLLRYCVSVSWRILRHAFDTTTMAAFSDEQRDLIQSALNTWSRFLKGEASSPGIHEQHFWQMGAISEHSMPDMPTNANRYLMRAMHMDIAWKSDLVMTYAKMGPFILFGYVQPPKSKWVGTKIHVRHGVIKPGKFELPGDIYWYIRDKMLEMSSLNQEISATQWDKIDAAIMGNLDRMRGSKQFEAILHDRRLFGEDAIIRKPKKA
jgi:hypothetical protein